MCHKHLYITSFNTYDNLMRQILLSHFLYEDTGGAQKLNNLLKDTHPLNKWQTWALNLGSLAPESKLLAPFPRIMGINKHLRRVHLFPKIKWTQSFTISVFTGVYGASAFPSDHFVLTRNGLRYPLPC